MGQNEPFKGLFMFAQVVLLPLGVLATVGGLVVGLIFGNWIVLAVGVVLVVLGFLIPAAVMSTIQGRLTRASDAYMQYLADPEAFRRKNPAGYAEIKRIIEQGEAEQADPESAQQS